MLISNNSEQASKYKVEDFYYTSKWKKLIRNRSFEDAEFIAT